MTMSGATSKSNGLRKRGRGRTKVSSSNSTKPETSDADADGKSASGSNALPASHSSYLRDRVVKFKPFIGITLLVVLPFAFHNTYLYVCLQRPEWLAGLASSLSACGLQCFFSSTTMILRPSFRASDTRQVLIVGTMSSGTTQVAHDLSTQLGLEIGHENSETRWSFVRDGTISWFHGIRFLPRPGLDDTSAYVDLVLTLPPSMQKDPETTTANVTIEGERLFRYLVNTICRDFHPNMGFHPFMFRDNGKCSLRQSWGKCWKEECMNLVEQEWGCALRQDSSPLLSSSKCITPFRKTLHQIRHPLKTIESLVTKFCIGGVGGELQPSFAVFANALFPKHDFSSLSCIEAAGYYVYEYNRAIFEATQKGYIETSFKVEEVTPCQIASLAGFFEENEEPPTEARSEEAEEKHTPPKGGYQQRIRDHLSNLCNSDDIEGISASGANRQMVSTKNKYNQGQLSLGWEDLLGGRHGSQREEADHDLQQRVKQIAGESGYH